MRIMIIDLLALFMRSYHAMASTPLTAPGGIPVGGVYQAVKAIIAEAKKFQPDYVIACDEGGSLFRKDWCTNYKANRGLGETNVDMENQKGFLRSNLWELGIPTIKCATYEADDTIATIVREKKPGVTYRILTVDQDLLQLVDDNIQVVLWNTGDKAVKEFYCGADVKLKSKFEVYPHQFPMYKAMVGDSSDNVIGISKFGHKAALEFFQHYETLKQGLEDKFAMLTRNRDKKLLENLDVIAHNFSLVTIYSIPNVKLELIDTVPMTTNVFVEQLNFQSLRESLLKTPWKHCQARLVATEQPVAMSS